jgi:hypothetical protein
VVGRSRYAAKVDGREVVGEGKRMGESVVVAGAARYAGSRMLLPGSGGDNGSGMRMRGMMSPR